MPRRRRVPPLLLALLPLVASAGAADGTDLPLPEELRARDAIRALRDAGRTLKRLSRADGDAAYDAWLARASEDVLGLAGRWASALDYFGRDFPPDALRADPERLAYAKRWLGERNAELAVQADALLDRLLDANRGYAGTADPERLALAGEALEDAREAGSGSA